MPRDPANQSVQSRAEKEMTEAILAYLDMHPQAMDTCDGIAEWWLVRKQIHVDLQTLQKVLARLTEDEILERVGPASNPCFRRRT